MSRTKKDRPYWVKLNDKSKRFKETHDHHTFGNPHPYVNNDGKVVTIYTPDYCTIDKPHNGTRFALNHIESYDPCTTFFYRHDQKKWYKDRATREDIRNWVRTPIRAEERKILNRAASSYNASGLVDEDLNISTEKFYYSAQWEY